MSAEDRSTEICGEKKGHNSHKVKSSKHNSEKMVKHKNTHSATCKSKKAGSQIANSKAPASQDDPVDSNIPVLAPDLQTTGVDQLGFQDRIYLLASVVFQNNHLEKPPSHRLVNYGKERGIALPKVKDEVMLRTAYELAFNTLKYQELLEDIMIDSCFYAKHPVPDDQMGLVAVMLYDFQDRKFLPRECHGEQEIIQEVRNVEKCLLGLKTKLAASLARCRIKHNLPSIECILPENVKMKQERSSNLPLYTWVNTLKSSLDEVQSVLKSAGFSQVKSIGQLEGQTFCQDPHCGDILVFPAQLKAQLFSTRLLSDHKLIMQDKSCSLGPNAVCSMLPEEGDVLMVGCFSGLTVSHTASLIAEKHKANSNNEATVYVCVSDRTDAQREDLQQVVSSMGCKNVKLIPGTFQSLDSADKQLQKVRVILLTPKCSVSAVNNPVELILQENGDTDLLQDLSQGSIAQSKLEALVAQQRKDIDHALKFPKVLAVVYTTRSSYPEENEEVVKRALKQAKARSEQEGEPKQTNIRLSASPFSSPCNSDGTEETDHFFTLEPSEQSNGCFLAVLTREPVPEVKETTQEVLTRAFATGILDRIGCSQPTRKKLHGRNNKQRKPACTRITQSHTSASIQPKDQVTKGSNTPTLCGHQDFTNRQQTSQVKSKALRLEPIKTTVSSPRPSRKEASSSSKTENTTTPKSFAPVCCVTINTTTSTTTTTTTPPVTFPVHPAAPLTTPVVRHRRAQQEVLRPMVLVLPPVHIDSFFPPQHSQTKFTSRFRPKMWIVPTQTVASSRSSDGLFKDLIVKSRSLL